MKTPTRTRPKREYWGKRVPMQAIRDYANQLAERFEPDKIILFGSYAYGKPHKDSDVDLLVVMSARNQHSQSVRIRLTMPAPFSMDLLVRTPAEVGWRLDERESFLTEVFMRGKVLYEKDHA